MNRTFPQKSQSIFIKSRILFIGYSIFAFWFFASPKSIQAEGIIQAEGTYSPLQKGSMQKGPIAMQIEGAIVTQVYIRDEHLSPFSNENIFLFRTSSDQTTQPGSAQARGDLNKAVPLLLTAPPSLFGSLFLGALTVPYQLEFFPELRLGIGGTCTHSPFCHRYQPKLLRTHLQMSFSDNIDWEDRADTAKEHHLPMFNLAVEPLEMTFTPKIQVNFGRIQLFRAPRNLNERFNVQATLATLRTHFGTVNHRWIRGGCFFDFAGPGIKYVSHAKVEVEPFVGLMAAGIKQGCDYDFGSKTVAINLGYAVRSELFVGQSGAGIGMRQGPFGAILSEHRFEGYFGLRISSPNVLRRIGIQSLQLNGTFGAYYHMDRGCLEPSTGIVAACGNGTSNFELRTGILLGANWDIGTASAEHLSPIRSSLQFGL